MLSRFDRSSFKFFNVYISIIDKSELSYRLKLGKLRFSSAIFLTLSSWNLPSSEQRNLPRHNIEKFANRNFMVMLKEKVFFSVVEFKVIDYSETLKNTKTFPDVYDGSKKEKPLRQKHDFYYV